MRGLNKNPMGELPGLEETKIDVPLIALDSLSLPRLDFMKVDVEGYEPKVIDGAIELISRWRPTIVLECWADHSWGASVEHTRQQFRKLLQLGYELIRVDHADWLFVPRRAIA